MAYGGVKRWRHIAKVFLPSPPLTNKRDYFRRSKRAQLIKRSASKTLIHRSSFCCCLHNTGFAHPYVHEGINPTGQIWRTSLPSRSLHITLGPHSSMIDSTLWISHPQPIPAPYVNFSTLALHPQASS